MWTIVEENTEINFFVSFVLQFAASMQESNIQLARPTKNVIMAVLTPKSVIELTAFTKFLDRQKAEFFMLYLCAFLPPTIHFCRSPKFPEQ